jgi:hypothetical protein
MGVFPVRLGGRAEEARFVRAEQLRLKVAGESIGKLCTDPKMLTCCFGVLFGTFVTLLRSSTMVR